MKKASFYSFDARFPGVVPDVSQRTMQGMQSEGPATAGKNLWDGHSQLSDATWDTTGRVAGTSEVFRSERHLLRIAESSGIH